jgi:nucleoside-diphosphate-sugar epimerase
LVTGGAGFIGSHLADRLVERGDAGFKRDILLRDPIFRGDKFEGLYLLSCGR